MDIFLGASSAGKNATYDVSMEGNENKTLVQKSNVHCSSKTGALLVLFDQYLAISQC